MSVLPGLPFLKTFSPVLRLGRNDLQNHLIVQGASVGQGSYCQTLSGWSESGALCFKNPTVSLLKTDITTRPTTATLGIAKALPGSCPVSIILLMANAGLKLRMPNGALLEA